MLVQALWAPEPVWAQRDCRPPPADVARLVELRPGFPTVAGPLAEFDPCHRSVQLSLPGFFADKLADKPGINVTLKHKAGVVAVRQGHSFSIVLTKDNKLFFRGSIEGVLESKTFTSVITTATFTTIEAGNNHFVALSGLSAAGSASPETAKSGIPNSSELSAPDPAKPSS